VHEVRALLLLTLIILKTLQQLEENILGNLAASPLQVCESGQPKVSLEVMSCGVEGSPDGEGVRVLAELQLGGLGKGVLGALLGVLLRGGRHLLLLRRCLLLQNMLLLLLVMANLLFVGNPYWFSLLRQISSVNHVRVPITCHPVRKNCGGFF